ncbi:MAG TPA: polyphosphate kinase 2 family protein [Candidatus Excrementavichristensenella intestinipullorum]|nr:polyphosphate kinase 2 family protein [Candidatus Excrementavichristensenella intestinipullorum]
MKPKDYRYNGKAPLALSQAPTGADGKVRAMKDELVQRTEENMEQVARLQERLYAGGREGLVIVLQAMDAAGKDSTIKHVMAGINPQGVRVYSFKQPSAQELSHDYLWRIVKCLPARGQIAIFNRSHYEDVLAVEVLKLYESFKMPQRCLTEDFIPRRLKQIAQFEEYLYDNGIRMVKIFLHLSKAEQKKRFLDRLDKPEKNWKFSGADLESRALWDAYQAAYERAINATATRHCPWYVLPADDKWFTRYLVSEAVLDALQRINPQFPELPPEQADKLPLYRRQLAQED